MSEEGHDAMLTVESEQEPDSKVTRENWVFPIPSLVSLVSWGVFVVVSGFGALAVIIGLVGLIGEEFTGAAEGFLITYGIMIFIVGIVLAIVVFICLKILTLPLKNKVIVLASRFKIGIGDASAQTSLGKVPNVGAVISAAKPYFMVVCLFAVLTFIGTFVFGTDRWVYIAIISLVISGLSSKYLLSGRN
jgi:hypothetical protein